MLEKVIRSSVNYLLNSKVISEDERDVYEYGFYTLYSTTIDLVSIFFIALLLRCLPETILYHLVFIPLGLCAGSYHASSRIKCFVMSTLIWLFGLFVAYIFLYYPLTHIAWAFISLVVIFVFAPIGHENNPLSEKKRKKMRMVSRILISVFFIAVVGGFVWENNFVSSVIAIGMLSNSFSLTLSLISHKRKGNGN